MAWWVWVCLCVWLVGVVALVLISRTDYQKGKGPRPPAGATLVYLCWPLALTLSLVLFAFGLVLSVATFFGELLGRVLYGPIPEAPILLPDDDEGEDECPCGEHPGALCDECKDGAP